MSSRPDLGIGVSQIIGGVVFITICVFSLVGATNWTSRIAAIILSVALFGNIGVTLIIIGSKEVKAHFAERKQRS